MRSHANLRPAGTECTAQPFARLIRQSQFDDARSRQASRAVMQRGVTPSASAPHLAARDDRAWGGFADDDRRRRRHRPHVPADHAVFREHVPCIKRTAERIEPDIKNWPVDIWRRKRSPGRWRGRTDPHPGQCALRNEMLRRQWTALQRRLHRERLTAGARTTGMAVPSVAGMPP